MNKTVNVGASTETVPSASERVRHAGRASQSIARIHLLGSMRATTYLGDNILPRSRKARAILGCLCIASGKPVPRARLAAMLWDRVDDTQARTSFRQALHELSVAMGPLADELIFADRESVRLNKTACWIDAIVLLAKDPSSSNSLRSDLAVLCSGELLEELDGVSVSFDQWLVGERNRFAEQLRGLLEAELREVDHPGSDAWRIAALARRLIAFDPTHEGASRALMRTLADMGEQGQALREYSRCRDALRKILNAGPSLETQALHDAVRAYSSHDAGMNGCTANDNGSRQGKNPARPLPARSRLRVGVFPFLGNRSANEENLGFSLSQEVAAGLARFRWFDVIAPVSLAPRWPSSLVSEHQLRNEFDYIVDGTISGNGKHLHISVRLLDLAEYARPVWNDCFKLAIGELHRLNELVTVRIAARIDPVILSIEGQPKRRENYGATGLLLLAIPLIFSMERKKYEEAGRLIDRALEIDSENTMVEAWAAHWHLFYAGQGWTQEIERTYATTQRHALRAIKLDPDNAEALGIYAHICSIVDKDFDSALHYFDRSLRLNPSLAFIWALSSATYSYIGEPEIALQRLERYGELAPFDPYYSWFEHLYTIAYAFKGDYERAAIVGRRVSKAIPEYVAGYKPLIASLGHLGRRDEAKPYVAKLLSLEPHFTVERFGRVYPFKHSSDRERYMEGLRRAGVPEC